MDFTSAADELYGVAPTGFVAARTRLAKAARSAGDPGLARRIGALRRPAPAAWAVNLLARGAAGDLAALLDAGAALRAAWASGAGLADLERRRTDLLAPLVRRAADLASEAGQPLREQAVREIEETLLAATVDAGTAERVREGRLTRPQSHTGFVLSGFPAEPGASRTAKATALRRTRPAGAEPAEATRPRAAVRSTGAPPSQDEVRAGRAGEPAKADRAGKAEVARRRLGRAERVLAEREERAAEAAETLRAASGEVGRLRRALERATAERDAAGRRAERAEAARERAAEAVRDLRDAVERDTRHVRSRAAGDPGLK
ncbi:hypothetical protein [Spirillospora albida]|uniref:hypothetical protein n=1 Tax=Spirillospora albida TaxID=58123 RepID=UPI0006913D9D|nr:hypothetical protein [Spirillospora albida]